MSGNVMEWCGDLFGEYTSSAQKDPRGAVSGEHRVFRGGDFGGDFEYLSIHSRLWAYYVNRWSSLGFRVARSVR